MDEKTAAVHAQIEHRIQILGEALRTLHALGDNDFKTSVEVEGIGCVSFEMTFGELSRKRQHKKHVLRVWNIKRDAKLTRDLVAFNTYCEKLSAIDEEFRTYHERFIPIALRDGYIEARDRDTEKTHLIYIERYIEERPPVVPAIPGSGITRR